MPPTTGQEIPAPAPVQQQTGEQPTVGVQSTTGEPVAPNSVNNPAVTEIKAPQPTISWDKPPGWKVELEAQSAAAAKEDVITKAKNFLAGFKPVVTPVPQSGEMASEVPVGAASPDTAQVNPAPTEPVATTEPAASVPAVESVQPVVTAEPPIQNQQDQTTGQQPAPMSAPEAETQEQVQTQPQTPENVVTSDQDLDAMLAGLMANKPVVDVAPKAPTQAPPVQAAEEPQIQAAQPEAVPQPVQTVQTEAAPVVAEPSPVATSPVEPVPPVVETPVVTAEAEAPVEEEKQAEPISEEDQMLEDIRAAAAEAADINAQASTKNADIVSKIVDLQAYREKKAQLAGHIASETAQSQEKAA